MKFLKILFPSLMVILISCQEVVDIKIDDTTKMMVLNGTLIADSTASVTLSRTRHILDNNDVSAILNADVSLSDSYGNTVKLHLKNSAYVNDSLIIRSGEQYTIKASAEGFEDISATCYVPEKIEIVKFDTIQRRTQWGDNIYELDIYFEDVPDEGNYYQLELISKYKERTYNVEFIYDTLYYDPVVDTVIMGYWPDSANMFYIRYSKEHFSTSDLSAQDVSWRDGVVFSDALFDGKYYSLSGEFWNSGYYSEDTSYLYVNLYTITEDYYKYLITKGLHYNAQDDPFAVPVVVYSNIDNGVGILGAKAISSKTIAFKPINYNYPDYYW